MPYIKKGYCSLNKFFKNTLIFAISNFSSKFLVFLLLPFYTRVLSPSEFGTSDLISITISLLLPIFTLSVSEGILRFTMQKGANINVIFTFGIKIVIIGFIALLCIYPFFLRIDPINKYLILFYSIYLTSTLNQYFNQFLRGIGNVGLIGIVGIFGTIITIVSNILFLAIYNFGIYGYLISILITNTLCMLILFYFGKLFKYFTFNSPSKELIKELLRYNIPLIPNRISWWIIMLSNRYVLNFFYGASLVGLFTAANRIPLIIMTIYGVVQQALLLTVIEDYEEKNSYDMFKKVYEIMNVVLIVTVVIINFAIKPLGTFLFAEDFSDAWRIVPLLSLSALFSSLHGNLTTVFSAVKQTKVLFVNSTIGSVINLILNIILVPLLGIFGVAIVSVCTYTIVWLHLLIKSKKYVGNYDRLSNDYICYLLILFQSVIIFNFEAVAFKFSFLVLILVIIMKFKEILSVFSILKQLFNVFLKKKIINKAGKI